MCHIALGITSSLGPSNLFGNWSRNGGQGSLLLLGVLGFCWTIWLSRNDVVFEKKHPKSFFLSSFQGNSLALPMGQVSAK